MPGSPPTRMALPGTSPPPSTRSSSPMPLRPRGGGASSPDSRPNASARPRAWPSVLAAGPAEDSPASSSIAFHAPQSPHCPAHLRCSAPHSRQMNRVAVFAIAGLRSTPRRGPEAAAKPPNPSGEIVRQGARLPLWPCSLPSPEGGFSCKTPLPAGHFALANSSRSIAAAGGCHTAGADAATEGSTASCDAPLPPRGNVAASPAITRPPALSASSPSRPRSRPGRSR